MPDPGSNSYFLRALGRSERVTACACERSGDVSLPAVLHLMGGDTIARKLAAGGWVAELLAAEADDAKALDRLFLRALARRPSDAERAAVAGLLKDTPRADVYKDVLWALLNSKEFVFNR